MLFQIGLNRLSGLKVRCIYLQHWKAEAWNLAGRRNQNLWRWRCPPLDQRILGPQTHSTMTDPWPVHGSSTPGEGGRGGLGAARPQARVLVSRSPSLSSPPPASCTRCGARPSGSVCMWWHGEMWRRQSRAFQVGEALSKQMAGQRYRGLQRGEI